MKKLLLVLALVPLLTLAQEAPDVQALQGKAEGGPFSLADYKAALTSLLPGLSQEKVEDRHETQLAVQNIGSYAGRPGAEAERTAFSQAALEVMANASQPAKVWLLRQLEVVGGNESVTALSELALDADRELRDVARRALQMNPSEQATDALISALTNAVDHEITTGLIYALGERKTDIAVSAIALYLGHDNYFVAAAAATALGRIASDAAVDALIAYRKSHPDETTAYALLTAAEMAQDASRSKIFDALSSKNEPESIQIAVMKTWVMYGYDTAAPRIKEAIASDSYGLIGAAGQLLANPDKHTVLTDLSDNLGDYSDYAQEQILQAIGSANIASAQNAVVGALSSQSAGVRAAAIRSLGVLGNPAAVKALLTFSDQADGNDASLIQRALLLTSGEGVNAAMAEVASKGQRWALQAVADRGITDAVPGILANLTQMSEANMASAGKALQKLADDSQISEVLKLINSENNAVRAQAELILSGIGSRSNDASAAVAAIASAYNSADEKGKLILLSALRSFGSDEAIALIKREMAAGSESIKDAAIRSLAGWSTPNAVSELLSLAKDDSTPLKYQVLALRGVNRIMVSAQSLSAKDRIEGILNALKLANRPEEKTLALSSLAQLKVPEAFSTFTTLLNDEALRNSAAMSGLQLAESMARQKKKEARAFANKIKEMNLSDSISKRAEKALSKIK